MLFGQALPETVLGEQALEIPIAGWLVGAAAKASSIQVTIDGESVAGLSLHAPLPPRMCSGMSNKVEGISFSTWVSLPAEHSDRTYELSIDYALDGSRRQIHRQSHRRIPEPIAVKDSDVNIAICMAVYEPRRERLERQIESIRNQTCQNWICIICDDSSSQSSLETIQQVVGDDHRFHCHRNRHNLGFYHNFEKAISLVPESIPYIALADQDDFWYPEKLERLVEEISLTDAALVYSDMRITDTDRKELAASYWQFRKNNYRDFQTLLVANTITGAASVFRSELRRKLLPFPPRVGDAFDDHWIGCCALVFGGIGYVDQPLYDYIQYDDSVIGHCGFEEISQVGKGIMLRSLFNPRNWRSLAGRLIGSSLAVYWHECRRIEAICKTLKSRGLHDKTRVGEIKLFSGGFKSWWLLVKFHLRLSESRRFTNNAELRLARGYFIHSFLNIFPSLRGF